MTEVGRAEVNVELNDRGLAGGLRKAEAQFKNTVEKIDRMKGDADVGINEAKYKAELAKAKAAFQRTTAQIDAMRGEAKLSANVHDLKRDLREAQLLVKKWEKDVRDAAKQDDARSAANKRRALGRAQVERDRIKMELDGEAELLRQHKLTTKEISLQNREHQESLGYQERKVALSERYKTSEAKGAHQILVLKQQWSKLTDEVEKYHYARKKTLVGSEARFKIDLDEDAARAKMVKIKRELEVLGGNPPVGIAIDTDVDRGRINRAMFNLKRRLTQGLEKAGNIGNLRLNIGPISGTVKTLMGAMAALSPVITSVIGGLGSLIGTVGAATTATAFLGGALITGLGASFLGVRAAFKPFIADFAQGTKAAEAYHTAVLKYGAGSKEAAKALEKQQNVMKNMSPEARSAATSWGKLTAAFKEGTKESASSNFGKVVKGAVEGANSIMPAFIQNTNKVMDIMGQESKGFFGKILSGQGGAGLKNIFAGFQAALPALLRGVSAFTGGLLGGFGKAAKYLPQLTGGFQRLGEKFGNWTGSDKFTNDLQRWMGMAKSLTSLFGAAGRVIMHFFGAGAGEGKRFMDDMTRGLNRWDESLTGGGKDKATEFFRKSVDGIEAFGQALGPTIRAFVQWSTAMMPVTTGMLTAVGGITNFISQIMRIPGAASAAGAAGMAFVAVFALGKIAAIANGILRVAAALKAVAAGQGLAAAAGILSSKGAAVGMGAGLAGDAAMLKKAKAAENAAKATRTLAAAEGVAAAAMGGTTVAAGSGAVALLSTVARATAAGAALTGLVGTMALAGKGINSIFYAGADKRGNLLESSNAAGESLKKLIPIYGNLRTASQGLGIATARSGLSVKEAAKNYEALRGHAGATGALLDLREATMQNAQAQATWRRHADMTMNRVNAQAASARKRRDDYVKGLTDEQRNTAMAQKTIAEYNNAVVATSNRAGAAAANLARGYRGLAPVIGAAEQQLGNLARQGKGAANIASKIAVEFEAPKDVGAISRSAKNALSQGVKGGVVFDIVANSKTAEEAIRRINRERMEAKKVQIAAKDAASAVVRVAQGVINRMRGKTVKAAATDGVTAVIAGAKRAVSSLRGKTVKASIIDGISGAIGGIQSMINSLHGTAVGVSVNVTKTVNTVSRALPTKATGGPRAAAAGDRPGMGPTAGKMVAASKTAQNKRVGSTRGGKFVTPTFLVGEESMYPETVIAHNPAYRQRNTRFLQSAANSFGYDLVEAAPTGRRPPPRRGGAPPPRRGGAPATKSAAPRYPVPNYIKFASVEEGPLQERFTTTQSSYREANNRYNALRKKIPKLHGRERGAAVRERNLIKAALPAKKRAYGQAKANYDAIHRVNQQMETLTSQANAERTKMQSAADKKPPNGDAWQQAKNTRGGFLNQLKTLYEQAKRYASGSFQAKIDENLQTTIADIQTNDQDAIPPPPEKDAPTLDNYIAHWGMTGEGQEIKMRQAIAGTTADPGDDRAWAGAAVNFAQRVFNNAQGTGNRPIITEAAEALKSAQDSQGSANSATADESAISAQKDTRIATLENENAINRSFAQTAGGPGDIGSGAFGSGRQAAQFGAGGGSPSIVINALHPGDPNVYRAIGNAAAVGFGYQGGGGNPRQVSGY